MSEDPRAAPGPTPALDPVDGSPRRSLSRRLFVAVRAGIIGGIVFWVFALAASNATPVQGAIRFGVGLALFILLVSLLRAPPEARSEERPR